MKSNPRKQVVGLTAQGREKRQCVLVGRAQKPASGGLGMAHMSHLSVGGVVVPRDQK